MLYLLLLFLACYFICLCLLKHQEINVRSCHYFFGESFNKSGTPLSFYAIDVQVSVREANLQNISIRRNFISWQVVLIYTGPEVWQGQFERDSAKRRNFRYYNILAAGDLNPWVKNTHHPVLRSEGKIKMINAKFNAYRRLENQTTVLGDLWGVLQDQCRSRLISVFFSDSWKFSLLYNLLTKWLKGRKCIRLVIHPTVLHSFLELSGYRLHSNYNLR